MLQKRATVYQLKGVNVHFSGKSQSENITNLAMIKNLEPNPYVTYMSTGWMKFISSNLKTQCHLVCFSCLESIEKKTKSPVGDSVLLLEDFFEAERKCHSGRPGFWYCLQQFVR